MFVPQHIPYNQTNAFSKIVEDYISGTASLRSFYKHNVTIEGIDNAIEAKKRQPLNRKLLAEVLTDQYRFMTTSDAVSESIGLLLRDTTFSICTAHQPNIYTGPLYFLYKILHTIKLSRELKEQRPEYDFVPVYYMGSEDADLDELNHFTVDGKRYEWKTGQKGAVGRMYVDEALIDLVGQLQQQIGVAPFGKEIATRFLAAFTKGKTIQQATLDLVNDLFGKYGLVVLIADEPRLKKLYIPVLEADLFSHEPSRIVEATCNRLAEHHAVQQYPRDINVFYLKDDIRQRIEKADEGYKVHEQEIRFTDSELRQLLYAKPELFSPNVILRGLYQETILPNIAFIGGGGELAYWLQLKDLFEHFAIPYPVLVLRNSFLMVEEKWKQKIEKLELSIADFFNTTDQLLNRLVERSAADKVKLNGNFEKAETLYDQISLQAGAVDATLLQHVAALKTRSLKYLQELEKKMLRAEKRKYEDQNRQITYIRSSLFPGDNLQERVENMSSFYAQWGQEWIDALLEHSLGLEQKFVILTHQKS